MSFPRIYAIHDQAITIEFSQEIDEQTNLQVIAWQDEIEANPFKGFIECVPAYSSLTIYVDSTCNVQALKEQLQTKLSLLEANTHFNTTSDLQPNKIIEIPVCYDLEFGFDLPWLSNYLNLSIQEIISLHSEHIFRVYMIGFIPGFPYMGSLPPALESPRKQIPSMKIPAGSIAIAGKQTGIYPADVPGGWQVIGRTPLQMFDKLKEPCSLLHAGEMIKFKPITREAFNQYS